MADSIIMASSVNYCEFQKIMTASKKYGRFWKLWDHGGYRNSVDSGSNGGYIMSLFHNCDD